MPTYDYKCEACGEVFEKFQSIAAAPLKKCPHCGVNRLKRLIGTGSGVIFKGGGFYQTDYRSDSYKAAAKAEGGGAKADEKPAARTEAGGGSEATPASPAKAEPTPPKPPKKKSA